MPRLIIPDRHQTSLANLRDLDPNSCAQLGAALERVPLTTKATDIASVVAISAQSIPDVKGIMDALGSLYLAKLSNESVALEQFADDVCDAMETLSNESKLSPDKRPEFKKRLITLLSTNVFTTLIKAADLATSDERTFCQARILTDLRPVFGASVDDGQQGFVLVHLLEIGYHEESRRSFKEFHVALDAEDLDTLKKVIERAEKKAQSVKTQLKDVQFLGIS